MSAASRERIIVGIFGGGASGKDTVAGLFERKGYTHVSSSELVRDEIAQRGQTTSRELQTRVANELRLANGVGYWVDLALRTAPANANRVAVSGLYSPGEGQYLVDELQGSLVGVIAAEGDDSALRYDRLQARSSGARDQLSREEFMAAHERECGGTQAHETNLDTLLGMARYTIMNTAGMEYLKLQVGIVTDDLERSVT